MVRIIWMLVVFISIIQNSHAQDDLAPVTKIGGMYYGKDPAASYSLCFERERLFARQAFSRGPRIDYDVTKSSPQSYGSMSLVLGYQFKYYPFYPLRGKPTRGLYLGVSPCYFVRVRDQFPYGPGVGFLMGYQAWILNKVAVSIEWSIANMRNVNPTLTSLPNTWYWNGFTFAKVGYRFNKS